MEEGGYSEFCLLYRLGLFLGFRNLNFTFVCVCVCVGGGGGAGGGGEGGRKKWLLLFFYFFLVRGVVLAIGRCVLGSLTKLTFFLVVAGGGGGGVRGGLCGGGGARVDQNQNSRFFGGYCKNRV